MKTLLLNPPSFPNFDGGASSRWPASREIASYWYPVWLAYPAGLIKNSRLLDASPHGVTPEQTIEIAKDYDFVTLYTSTPGFKNDVKLAEMMKSAKPDLKLAFVGPPVTSQPDQALNSSPAIDFIVRKEIDYPLAEFAEGRPLESIQNVSYRKNGKNIPLIANRAIYSATHPTPQSGSYTLSLQGQNSATAPKVSASSTSTSSSGSASAPSR